MFSASLLRVRLAPKMDTRVRRLEPLFVNDVFLRKVKRSLDFPWHSQTQRGKVTSGQSCINELNTSTRSLGTADVWRILVGGIGGKPERGTEVIAASRTRALDTSSGPGYGF